MPGGDPESHWKFSGDLLEDEAKATQEELIEAGTTHVIVNAGNEHNLAPRTQQEGMGTQVAAIIRMPEVGDDALEVNLDNQGTWQLRLAGDSKGHMLRLPNNVEFMINDQGVRVVQLDPEGGVLSGPHLINGPGLPPAMRQLIEVAERQDANLALGLRVSNGQLSIKNEGESPLAVEDFNPVSSNEGGIEHDTENQLPDKDETGANNARQTDQTLPIGGVDSIADRLGGGSPTKGGLGLISTVNNASEQDVLRSPQEDAAQAEQETRRHEQGIAEDREERNKVIARLQEAIEDFEKTDDPLRQEILRLQTTVREEAIVKNPVAVYEDCERLLDVLRPTEGAFEEVRSELSSLIRIIDEHGVGLGRTLEEAQKRDREMTYVVDELKRPVWSRLGPIEDALVYARARIKSMPLPGSLAEFRRDMETSDKRKEFIDEVQGKITQLLSDLDQKDKAQEEFRGSLSEVLDALEAL